MKCQSDCDSYGEGEMRLFMTGMAALLISGCNADMQQLARASCALTQECYAPGVTPGTNPYRNNTPGPAVLNTRQTRKTAFSFPVGWDQLCPTVVQGKYYLTHSNVGGKKVCEYR